MPPTTLLDRLWRIADARPDAIAFASRDGTVSYGQLRHRAYRLARALRERRTSSAPLIALYMPREARLLVAITGVMASGAAYTVVEAEGNRDENMSRLAALSPDLVVTSPGLLPLLSARRIPAITEAGCPEVPPGYAPPDVSAEDTAYVLFTSGSTGIPKGVAISHGNIRHYAVSLLERLGITEPLRYAHVSTLSADLGNTGLFLAMWTGGALHLVDGDTRRDPRTLLDHLATHRIDFLKITPSHWRAIFSALAGQSSRPQLRYLLLGGESLPVKLARDTLQSGITSVLANHYGPTETTVGVAANPIRTLAYFDTLTSDAVPIGRPLGQTRLLVRDQTGNYRDRAADGELFIGGPLVGQGYRNDPAATEARFLTGIEGGLRFYRTGDFVRIDAAGVVSFLGRIDRQTKINGYRVELEHVESVLRGIPGIDNAAAYAIRAGDKNVLAVAIVATATRPAPAALKHALKATLPDHMIPTHVQWVDQFPLNPNGKIDLEALRSVVERGLAAATGARNGSALHETDPVRAEIAEIWARCLRRERFTAQDDFFELGGDSLDAIMVISELQARGYRISTRAFLERPTIEALAAVIGQPEAPPVAAVKARTSPRHEGRSSTGLPANVQRELDLGADELAKRRYETILLTGATGYIGAHVLHELLIRTSAHVYCLLRSKTGIKAQRRLEDVFTFYFPANDIRLYKDRLTVIEGDVTKHQFGLDPATFARLAGSADAIYHFAADTRLFGTGAVFEDQNVTAVKTAILAASTGRPKDLHYMSTLAVCGINLAAEEVMFSEASLDIGQEFQNDYERTKYRAEKLVLEYVAQGGLAYIYRTGTVSGHSRTGRMQVNAGDNRFIQLLRAVAKLGEIPAGTVEAVVLSAVDTVAQGVVALSCSVQPSGAVLHVSSHHEIALHDIFTEMRAAGIPLEPSDAQDLASLFEHAGHRGDPEVALGYFWATRRPRNVRYSHARTQRLLDKLGCRFMPLDQPWIRTFISGLIAQGMLTPATDAGLGMGSHDAGIPAGAG